MKREDIIPLFRSGHDACRFAYAFSSQQYQMTVMARMMKGSGIGSGRGLHGLDGAAIAGTVKRHVEELPEDSQLVIGARYELDRARAVVYASALIRCVMPALGTGGHHRHMVRALVCRYFHIKGEDGAEVKLSSLCDQFALSADTMTRRWRATKARLREIESRAQAQADDRMTEAGLVG